MTKSLAVVLSCLVAILSGQAAAAAELETRPVAAPEPQVGRLEYRGGWELRSDTIGFGGFSGLLVDGEGLATVISDRGQWTVWRLVFEGGDAPRLAGVEAVEPLAPLRRPNGRPVTSPYHDAESLARLPGGALVAGFEQLHRLWRYPEGLGHPSRPVPGPPGLKRLPPNSGIEALAILHDGRWLALAEGGGEEVVPAWLRDEEGAWHSLGYRRTPPYRPTAAAALPDGDIVVLERRFSVLGGFGSRLVRLPGDHIRPGVTLEGQELARLKRPWPTENFEGLAFHRSANGEILLLLLSDDNFSGFQRTLLLAFSLIPPME